MSSVTLSPREEAIVQLAKGTPPGIIARRLDTTEDAVRDVGVAYEWPTKVMPLKAVASLLRRGEQIGGQHAGELPGPDAPALDRDGDETVSVGPAIVGEPVPVGDDPIREQIREHLEELERREEAVQVERMLWGTLDRPRSDAQLRAPLVVMRGPDGADVVVSVVHADVEIDPAGAMRCLTGDETAAAVRVHVAQELTAEGIEIVRALAAVLPVDDGGEQE